MKLWHYGHTIEYLGQRYHLKALLGRGGMASVYLAWDKLGQREVALKILKSDDLDQERLNRFLKEANRIVYWQHPHILRIYEDVQVELLDPDQGSTLFYLVIEYVRGGDLQKRLTPGKPLPLSTTFALFRQLCDAVQYAHEQGVIHRDIKPANILFRHPPTGREEVVLSDFGLAVDVDASHHTFARGGTPAYMAPEQFAGHAQPASDIFALGIILYQLCTGRLPFRQGMQGLLHSSGTFPQPPQPSLLNPMLPPELDEAILRALRQQPTERYHDARAFWDALECSLTLAAQTSPLFSQEVWPIEGKTWILTGSQGRLGNRNSRRTAEQQNSRTAEQQNSRTAEQQNSRTAEQQNSRTAEQQNSRTAEQQNSRTAEQQNSRPTHVRYSLGQRSQNRGYVF